MPLPCFFLSFVFACGEDNTHTHTSDPALPEYYNSYEVDQDYIGALTQYDFQVGRLMKLLSEHDAYANTLIVYSSDNGPHQGLERTDIRYSTSSLRQCKVCHLCLFVCVFHEI